MSMYSGIQLKVPSSLCFMFIKHLNSGILFVNTTPCTRPYGCASSSTYDSKVCSLWETLYTIVKALPKLML